MTNRLKHATRYRRGRNFINIGDVVRVRSLDRKRNGFQARVRGIRVDRLTGEVAEIEVFGGPPGREMVRTLRPERIERVAQTRAGTPRELRR
ncbi:MAG: hypothetical protein ACRDZW_11195 [Acidimicrobiales bacterium]